MAEIIYPETRSVCYWGHTTNGTLIRLCKDGRNYVCPRCCHEHCRYKYPALYSACASAGWPVWPPGVGESRRQWKVGDRVLANWTHDFYWYPATVKQIDGERIYVHFDDGDKEWTIGERLMNIDLEVGDRVYCRWKGGRFYYPGKIASKDGEKILVVYDDGDIEWTTISYVRVTR